MRDMGLNIHNFTIPECYMEFAYAVLNRGKCTIRTDHAWKTDDLPFYVISITEENNTIGKFIEDRVSDIWDIAYQEGYKLIISDGIKFDPIQEYNMTVKLEKNGDFIFEASELKIPLRHMYRHPLLSCCGNVADDVRGWHIFNQRFGLDRISIKKDLELLYTYEFFGKWLEITKYPEGVGTKNENIIFWQIR